MQFLASHELSVAAAPPEILPAHTAEHQDLRLLLSCWQRQAGGKRMPPKPIVGREIGALLKRIHFSDVIEGGRDFRFRLLGDAVFQCLTVKQTGRLVSDHPDMGVRMRYPIMMREVVRLKEPVRGLATKVSANYRARIESIWLPFGEGDVAQIMGLSVLTAIDEPRPVMAAAGATSA